MNESRTAYPRARFVSLSGISNPAVMTEPLVHAPNTHRPTRRRAPRTALLGVRAWTGRSAILAATSTPRPPIATTETGKTRVSDLRVAARPADALLPCARAGRGDLAFAHGSAGDPRLMAG
jgi:hypothetical protein